MSAFIEVIQNSKGIVTYDLLRNAMFHVGLPFHEEELDLLYEEYQKTGQVPDFLEDMLDQYGYYGDE